MHRQRAPIDHALIASSAGKCSLSPWPAEKDFNGALSIFEQSLTLPGTGLKRFKDKPAEASAGERQAALYNIACCHSQLGDLDAALKAMAQASVSPGLFTRRPGPQLRSPHAHPPAMRCGDALAVPASGIRGFRRAAVGSRPRCAPLRPALRGAAGPLRASGRCGPGRPLLGAASRLGRLVVSSFDQRASKPNDIFKRIRKGAWRITGRHGTVSRLGKPQPGGNDRALAA